MKDISDSSLRLLRSFPRRGENNPADFDYCTLPGISAKSSSNSKKCVPKISAGRQDSGYDARSAFDHHGCRGENQKTEERLAISPCRIASKESL